jgi:Tfp pilus assembly protein PilV
VDWHKLIQLQHRPPQRTKFPRSGSLVIEAVIAVALLATAAYGLAKLASSAAALSRQSDQRLAATLAAENTVERLRRLPAERLAAEAGGVAHLVSESAACEVKVSTDIFSVAAGKSVHVRVDASPAKNIRVTLHDWRWVNESSEQNGASETSAESTETDALPSEVNDA